MLGTRVGSMDLNHHLTQPFRIWLRGVGGTKASLMLGTKVGSMDLNHHLTQPFRIWLRGVGGTKASLMLGTIRGYRQRIQQSQGERRIPTDVPGGRRKAGRHIPSCIHIYFYSRHPPTGLRPSP